MSLFYFLELHSGSQESQALSDNDLEKIGVSSQSLPHLIGLNLFTLARGEHDPFLKDENPPVLVIQATVENSDSLDSLLKSSQLIKLLKELAALALMNVRLSQQAFAKKAYLSTKTAKGFAELSYLVNYQKPAEDEAAFIAYYCEHHPQILMEFSDIRRVELGVPVIWDPPANIEVADRMLYCEVSFDDIDALNVSLRSDIRAKLRVDYECFPPFSGAVTHFAMHRRTLI